MYKRNSHSWIKHLDFILLDLLSQQLAFCICYCLYNQTWILPYANPYYRGLGILLAALDFAVMVIFNTMHGVLKRGYIQELS